MIARTLRAALFIAAAVANASADVPRLARTAQDPIDTHLGFDTSKYPGDAAMNAWKKTGKYSWVGFYLEAPCRKDHSWTGKRARLEKAGWGLAVVYVGPQTWNKPIPVSNATGSDCSRQFVNAAQGKVDARRAIAEAKQEGFDRGTVIFLDIEAMNTVPKAMRDYYKTWVRTLIADGRYRPGIYSHTKNAQQIYSDVKSVYRQAGLKSDPPFWIASTRGFSERASPTDVGHHFADMWQGKLDITRTHNGVRLPVDISVSDRPSPSEATY